MGSRLHAFLASVSDGSQWALLHPQRKNSATHWAGDPEGATSSLKAVEKNKISFTRLESNPYPSVMSVG
jgi:hypothetical protein